MPRFDIMRLAHAPVAQLDRVSVSEAEGREFESRRARHQQVLSSPKQSKKPA